jgi:hypothetical protein
MYICTYKHNNIIKMGKTEEKVVMVLEEGEKATRNYYQTIKSFVRLGKEIRISPKVCATVNKSGFKTEFFVETVSVNIGIGKDHTADLVMTVEAWKALLNGAEINITTTEEWKKLYVYKTDKNRNK